MNERNIPESIWMRYMKKYKDKYLLSHDEIGIWGIRLKENLGFIQPYSIAKQQLVAVLTFRSSKHKTYFKKKLSQYDDTDIKTTQEGECELSIRFNENDIKNLEYLFKIRKKYHVSEKQRKILIERITKARSAKRL